MGTSYVNFGEAGFWMRDSILELWLRLLSLHLPEPRGDDSSLVRELTFEIRSGWLLNSKGYFNGCVSCNLEKYAGSEPGRSIVLMAIESLTHRLSKAPESLDKEVLNLLGWDRCEEFTQDYPTKKLLDVAMAFRDLIEGKITSGNHDCQYMPGSERQSPLKPIDP